MNLQDSLRPKGITLMLVIALISLLSLGGFVAKQPAEASERDTMFSDIQPGSEYEEALISLVNQGIIFGYSDGTFRPSETLNREQAAVILARALRLNLDAAIDDPNFQDVNKSSNYYRAIAAIVSAGIFQGYTDGTFKPDQSLTRAEMAKILVVAYQLPKEELVVNPFKDVSSTSWYAPYLPSLIKNKITAGTSQTTYSPNNAVTRGDMALFIYRCQQLGQQNERIIDSELTTITTDSVQLGNESFALTDELKAWITPENLPILKNSRVKAHIIGDKISRIVSITLYADGLINDEIGNSNVALAGNGAVIDATVIIKGDHLSIKDATITGDLIIENEVKNSFYLENVIVKGSTNLSSPQEKVKNSYNSKLHLHNSILQSVNVSMESFTIKLTGETKVNEIDLLVNASIEADASITIPIVKVDTGALNTALNAVIDSLYVENTNSRVTLHSNAIIEDLRLKLKDDVRVIFLDYELIKHKIIRINGIPNIDLQPPAGGSPNSGQNSKLIAAKNAVASLFMDSTKTALNIGVNQAAIDDANAKVDLVADGTEKSALVADLQLAQQLLDAKLEAIANLHAATEAVNALFSDSTKKALKASVDQTAIDAANVKVALVADGAEKTALVVELQFAQQLLDAKLEAVANLQAATEAVNGLFSNNTKTALKAGVNQAAIDAARAKVALVADGTEKSALLADLQFAQQLLDAQLEAIANLQAATEAVSALFTDSTKTALKAGVNQAAIDAAKAKVALIADGAEKSALQADLQIAQQLLDVQLEAIANLQAATEAVNALFSDNTKTALKAGVNQVAIDAASAKVALVADGTEKSALLADLHLTQQLLDAQLEAIANLQAATEAVNALFTDNTKTALKAGVNQAAIDAASAKVAIVADGTEKSALLADLQFAQQLLDAQLEAIANLQAATEAVNALFSDNTKTALKAGVNQVAIDAARAKVALVADGTEKSALLAGLQLAQQLLDDQLEAIANLQAATDAVNALFSDSTRKALKASVDQAAIDAANAKVALVADGTEKSALLADLQLAKQLLDAKLEAIANLQEATDAVNALFSDNTKTALKAGVNQAAIDAASAKVAIVADGTEKSALLADLQFAQQLLDDQLEAIASLQAATEAVNALFSDNTKTVLKAGVNQVAIDDASAKVALVADGTEKSELQADLQIAQQLLNAQLEAIANLQAATDAVNALFADNTKTTLKADVDQAAIDAASAKVALVADGTEKSALLADLQLAQQLLDAQLEAVANLQAATEAVNALFTDSTKTALKADVNQTAIDAANAKVALVANGIEKSALLADLQLAQHLLDAQLEAVANLQAATEAVNGLFSDSTKTALKAGVNQAAINNANAKVALVMDGTEKSALLADLQTAQQLLDVQLEAIANLQAATEAVHALFTDSTKTALKAGVNQAAIEAASAKVAIVADGTEKSALLADLQLAQQLLDAKLEAIANLQAATEAVNALFTDSTKTVLKAGVNQAAIDAASAKVALVADGSEKSALLDDLQLAQQLLDAQLEAIANLQAATEAVNALFTDNTKTALKAGVNQAAIDAASAKVVLVADGTEKSALLADLQLAQQLLDAKLEAVANLQAATEAVNALFTDSTKTALKADVNQTAIDAANAKVALVANGTEKSALLADLQLAQQLLDAKLEAIANLQAATEAVNALFTDSTKTALKAGVNQVAIDAASAKVALVADGTEKSVLLDDLQLAQQLLDAQLEAIANLQAATEAVNALFTDNTKTALKADVNQAAINDASAKVALVADGTEKSALLADLQLAQQLLDAQLEAIANLQAATEAVNALFTDSTKTALKAGVDQAAIDAAKAKVDLVVDGTEKSALEQAIETAQELLDQVLDPPALTGGALNVDTVRITFTDDAAWRDNITGVYLNGNSAPIHSSRVNSTSAGLIVIDLTGVSLSPGTHQFLIKAEGYADAVVTIEIDPPLAAPALTGTATNVDTVRITFTEDAAWRDNITGVYLNGNSTPIHSSRVNSTSAGLIEINFTNASLSPGTHQFLIKAEGYADASVTIEVDPPLAAPALTGTATNVDTVRITFTDDAAWRDNITGVYLNGNSAPIHSSRVNSTSAGLIVIDLTGVSLSPGTHQFLIKAEGYADAVVTIEIDPPLAAPALTGTVLNVDTVRITFTEDAAWRGKITGVYQNGNSSPIHSSRVNKSNAGVIEINLSGASLSPGTHQFLIKANGYADTIVTIEVDPPLAAPTLTGTAPNVDTVRITFTEDAAWREKITGVYQNGNSSPIHSSRVNKSNAGVIEINLSGASLSPGTHQFLIKANGYADTIVTIEVDPPLAAPTLTGTAPNIDTVRITFTEDAAWRGKITGVYLNGNSWPVHSSRVNTTTEGIIEIDFTEASLSPGTHEFLIKAEGYEDATAVIIIAP